MKINKIPKGSLRTIVGEVILSAKELGIKLNRIYADWWESDSEIGAVHIDTKEGLININYFKREGEVVFCNPKKGKNKLADTIYKNIGVNHPQLTVCY